MRTVVVVAGVARYSCWVSAWWQWGGLFAAGGLGVCLRHALAGWVDGAGVSTLPGVGVLAANLGGCLAIGALAAALPAGPVRMVLLVGLLGGFTTYSSFALQTVALAETGRLTPLVWQLGLHLVGGAAMVMLGAALVGWLGWTARTG